MRGCEDGWDIRTGAVAYEEGCYFEDTKSPIRSDRGGSLNISKAEGYDCIYKVTGWPFPKAKIRVDITLVVLAVLFCFLLLGSWKWEIVGIGTLFAMVYVGVTVRLFNKHLAWFDRLLHYRPGCRRYVYGLARYIRRQM